MGELVPIGLVEALAGDTFQHATSVLIRMKPLIAPVMHPVVVRIHHWFVPHRLVWNEWEQFITGGEDGLGDGATYPTIGALTVTKGSLDDYLGVPPGSYDSGDLSGIPRRGYNRIFNEWF